MIYFVVVDDPTGRVKRAGRCADDVIADQAWDTNEVVYAVSELINPNHYWWDASLPTPGLVAQTALGASWDKTEFDGDGVDYATLSPLPNPTTVTVGKTDYVVTDGAFELASSTPGEYFVQVDMPQFLRETWRITAI